VAARIAHHGAWRPGARERGFLAVRSGADEAGTSARNIIPQSPRFMIASNAWPFADPVEPTVLALIALAASDIVF